ncbi:hypothetical protein JCM11641_002069 [Rhodosporidiobolus odoratus]
MTSESPLAWAMALFNSTFRLPASALREYKHAMETALETHPSQLANIHSNHVYRAAFHDVLHALNSDIQTSLSHGDGSGATQIPADIAAAMAVNLDRLGRTLSIMLLGTRAIVTGQREEYVARYLPQQNAALAALCGRAPMHNCFQHPELYQNIVTFISGLNKRLAVLCTCCKYAATGGPEATEPFLALYELLRPHFAAATPTHKDACFRHFWLTLEDLGEDPRANTEGALSDPAYYLELLGVKQASLSKPEIGRRAARMYYSGGTKEGWEKAAMRRFA